MPGHCQWLPPRWRHRTTVFLPLSSLLSIPLTCPVPLDPRAFAHLPQPSSAQHSSRRFQPRCRFLLCELSLITRPVCDLMALCHLQYFTKLASTALNIISPSPVSPMKFWVPYGQGMVCFCSLSTPQHWHRQATMAPGIGRVLHKDELMNGWKNKCTLNSTQQCLYYRVTVIL